jgi:hypothetical protein
MKNLNAKNRSAVLAQLSTEGPGITRDDIALAVGISNNSVGRGLKFLIAEGLAHLSGYADTGHGGPHKELYSAGPPPPDLCLVRPKRVRPPGLIEAAKRVRDERRSVRRDPLTAALFGPA